MCCNYPTTCAAASSMKDTKDRSQEDERQIQDALPGTCKLMTSDFFLRLSKLLWLENCFSLKSCRLKHSVKKSLQLLILIVLCSECFGSSLPSMVRSKRMSGRYGRGGKERCEHISIPFCMNIGYNLTDLSLSPSNKYDPREVQETVNQFQPVVDVDCSNEFRLLVCAIYTPLCIEEYPYFMPPCRHICQRAQHGCGPYFEKYRVDWPQLLRCEQFPPYMEGNQLCLHFNVTPNHDGPTSPPAPLRLKPPSKIVNKPTAVFSPMKFIEPNVTEDPVHRSHCTCHCRAPMVEITNQDDPLYDKVMMGRQPNCVMSCRSPYYTRDQLDILVAWITALSIVCFIVTSVTVGTFLIDGDRFKYPGRSIIFLSLCYMFVSLGFLIRVVAGHEAVACGWRSDRTLHRTTVPFLCGLVYFLIYFFSMAGSIWWVILSVTWFLASGLKWGSEAISALSQWFHVIAWFFPTLQIMTVFSFALVDGDPVSGICFVGNQNSKDLDFTILTPMIFYLSIGSLFLCFGFFDLCVIRSSIRKAKKKTDKFDKLMRRIATFSIVYILLSAILIACYFYEQQNRDNWANAHNCLGSNPDGSCYNESSSRPHLGAMIVKYSSTLLIGVANGIWICSRKTIRSWKKFYEQSFHFLCGSAGIISWFKTRRNKLSDDDLDDKLESSSGIIDNSSNAEGDPEERYSSTPTRPIGRSSREDASIPCGLRESGDCFVNFVNGLSGSEVRSSLNRKDGSYSCRVCKKLRSYSPEVNYVNMKCGVEDRRSRLTSCSCSSGVYVNEKEERCKHTEKRNGTSTNHKHSSYKQRVCQHPEEREVCCDETKLVQSHERSSSSFLNDNKRMLHTHHHHRNYPKHNAHHHEGANLLHAVTHENCKKAFYPFSGGHSITPQSKKGRTPLSSNDFH